jgi:hypothetical protein
MDRVRRTSTKRIRQEEFLRESLLLLVRLCGLDAVRSALSALDDQAAQIDATAGAAKQVPSPTVPRTWVPRAVATLQETEPDKYAVLRAFFSTVESGELLPESEDVRRFAESLGLKQVHGTKRRELIAKLADPMVLLTVERIRELVDQAKKISAQERNKGYSILTDKLLEGIRK